MLLRGKYLRIRDERPITPDRGAVSVQDGTTYESRVVEAKVLDLESSAPDGGDDDDADGSSTGGGAGSSSTAAADETTAGSGGDACVGAAELVIADLYDALSTAADLYSCDGADNRSMIACMGMNTDVWAPDDVLLLQQPRVVGTG